MKKLKHASQKSANNHPADDSNKTQHPISQEQYHRELAQAHEFFKKSGVAAPAPGQESPIWEMRLERGNIRGLGKDKRLVRVEVDPNTGQDANVHEILDDDEWGESEKQNIPSTSEDSSPQEHHSDEIRESQSKVRALLKELLWCLNAQGEAARKNKQSFFDQQQIADVIRCYERLARQNGFAPDRLFSSAEQFRLWSGAGSELGETPTALAIRVARIEKELSTSLGQLESFREAERDQTKAAKSASTAANLNLDDTPVSDESSRVAVQEPVTPTDVTTPTLQPTLQPVEKPAAGPATEAPDGEPVAPDSVAVQETPISADGEASADLAEEAAKTREMISRALAGLASRAKQKPATVQEVTTPMGTSADPSEPSTRSQLNDRNKAAASASRPTRKEVITKLLRSKGLSGISALANKAGVKHHTAADWAAGTRNTYLTTKEKLAKALEIPLKELP